MNDTVKGIKYVAPQVYARAAEEARRLHPNDNQARSKAEYQIFCSKLKEYGHSQEIIDAEWMLYL